MCCGFVGDIVGGVVDVIGSVAEFVVDNALPIIETVALTSVLGPGGLGLSELASTAISRVAVTALNGGSLGSIAAAGITPFIPSIGNSLGVNLDAGSFLKGPISQVITDPTMAKIVSSAVGSGLTGGVVAAVTGGDIAQAAMMAGASSLVSAGLSKTWDTIKSNVPAITDLSNQFKNIESSNPEAVSTYKNIGEMQSDLEGMTSKYNSALDKYNNSYNNLMDKEKEYYANPNKDMLDEINNKDIPALKDLSTSLTDLKSSYDTKLTTFQDYLKTNQADIERFAPVINQMNDLQNNYDVLSGQILANNTALNVQDAIQKGDFTKAAELQNQFDQINSSIAKIDQTAMVGHDLSNQDIALLNQIYNAPDDATKNQLISQAKLNPTFADLMSKPVNTESVYQNLVPKLPDTGVPSTSTTDTGTTITGTTGTTTTQTTPPPSHVSTSTLSPIANTAQNIVSNLIKQGFTNSIINNITGGGTGTTGGTTTTGVSKPKPAQHVDVSSLKPFTGSLPTGLPSTTPTTTPTITPTTQTGGLGTVTNTATTPTQTANSGLQSTTQPQTQLANKPASHVDISTLTPVTNTTQLANLGLNLG